MSKLTTFVAGAGFGAALAYFLDPRSGGQRRDVASAKAGQVASSGPVQTVAHTAGAQAQGVVAKAKQAATGGESAPGDDNTLKSKVETEIFRPADAPKGSVNVNVANGVVELRGEVPDQGWHDRLESEARKIDGVRDVRNLLHLPGETPVNVAGTPGVAS
jgi:osmotically-inducible protein OsmY